MNTRNFRDKYGREECAKVCLGAGTTYDYYKQLCQKERRPSMGMARRLSAASGGRLDVLAMLEEKDEPVSSQKAS